MAVIVGVLTIGGHTEAAVAYSERTDLFMALGHRDPWTDLGNPLINDTNPPAENPLALTAPDIFIYKECTLQLVLPALITDVGAFSVGGEIWKVVNEADFRTGLGRHVYVSALLDGDEGGKVPMLYLGNPASYRQVSMWGGIVRAPLVSPTETVLLPSEIEPGAWMEYLYNTRPVPLDAGHQQMLRLIITK